MRTSRNHCNETAFKKSNMVQPSSSTSSSSNHITAVNDPLNLGCLSVDTDFDDLDALLDSPVTKRNDKPTLATTRATTEMDCDNTTLMLPNDQPSPQQLMKPLELPPVMNAVQMEVQENAKVPNLYHVPLRRTNPVDGNLFGKMKQQQIMQQQQQDQKKMIANIATAMTDNEDLVDEILRLTEADVTLTENFLANGQRLSAAAAYSNAGALMSSIGANVANPSSTTHGRSVPLPIPTKRKSPEPKQIPVSHTAAIPTSNVSSSSNVANNNIQQNPNISQFNQQSTARNFSTPKPDYMIRSNTNIPILSPSAALAKAPTPSVIDATKKRSQFGFGGNHTVPSVPLPPSHTTLMHLSTKSTKSKSSCKTTSTALPPTKAKTKTIPAGKKRTSPIPISHPAVKLSSSNEGASYERKKQRAKDARVKLNESIERLSVAINLAGTQSKQRAKAHAYWASKETSVSQENPNNVGSSGSGMAPVSPSRNNGIKDTVTIMNDAVNTAETAKKWERPSFVGSAATMIQNLNAQCEALMRELVDLKKLQNENDVYSYYRYAKKLKLGIGVVSDISQDEFEHGYNINDANNALGRKLKRIKISHEDYTFDINAIIKRDKVILMIGSFLDPQSILRFMCVSKSWQVQLNPLMQNNSLWSPLCIARFGPYSVREWFNQEEDKDIYTEDNNGLKEISHIKLYRAMNESNVKRKCHFEGDLDLGNGKINNVACAWLSAVERSNGETLRSVLTTSNGDLKYASLPIVELRIHLQNIGISDTTICVPEQIISVDTSTKRRGEEMFEITSDQRMRKKIYCNDGSVLSQISALHRTNHTVGNLIKLNIFESAVISVFIHAKGCPTTAKFIQRANFAKILLNVRGTTVPLVIPITNNKK